MGAKRFIAKIKNYRPMPQLPPPPPPPPPIRQMVQPRSAVSEGTALLPAPAERLGISPKATPSSDVKYLT